MIIQYQPEILLVAFIAVIDEVIMLFGLVELLFCFSKNLIRVGYESIIRKSLSSEVRRVETDLLPFQCVFCNVCEVAPRDMFKKQRGLPKDLKIMVVYILV